MSIEHVEKYLHQLIDEHHGIDVSWDLVMEAIYQKAVINVEYLNMKHFWARRRIKKILEKVEKRLLRRARYNRILVKLVWDSDDYTKIVDS